MWNRILFVLVAVFYPASFFVGNNWHLFTPAQNIILLIGAPLICILIFPAVTKMITGAFTAGCRIFKILPQSSFPENCLFDAILALLTLSACVFFFRKTLTDLPLFIPLLYICVPLVLILMTLYAYKKGLRRFIAVLGALSAISVLTFLYNARTGYNSTSMEWLSKNKGMNDAVRFTKSPNVYLLVAESYPSREALKAVYGIDNSSFYRRLESLGFSLFHNCYSNYKYTFASLPSLFAMEHHYYRINLGNFDSIGGRSLLEAKTDNPVVDIFRNNGYKIIYLHDNPGLITRGAAVDFYSPSISRFLALNIFLFRQDMNQTVGLTKRQDIDPELKNQVSASVAADRPSFFFLYLSPPGHSPSRFKTQSIVEINDQLVEFRHNYSEKINAANSELTGMIQLIMGMDPDPLIIIIGDHGSRGYRLKLDEKGNQIPDNLFVLDRFGVLAAIRFPNGYDGRYDGNIKTLVNTFRYVFSFLSQKEDLIQHKAEDDSYDSADQIVIKDGRISDIKCIVIYK